MNSIMRHKVCLLVNHNKYFFDRTFFHIGLMGAGEGGGVVG